MVYTDPMPDMPNLAKPDDEDSAAPTAVDAKGVQDGGPGGQDRPPDAGSALSALARENEELRQALARERKRVAYLEQLADRDSLVPAYNRRAFMRELRRTISYGARYGTVNSVLYFDINGMKGINDTLGHAAGDAALLRIASLLDANLRASDIVGRLGGDEFGVILVNADGEQALRKASSLAAAIAGETLRWEGWSIPLETAFGIHTISNEDTALSALYAADQSMYLHKEDLRARKSAARSAAPRES